MSALVGRLIKGEFQRSDAGAYIEKIPEDAKTFAPYSAKNKGGDLFVGDSMSCALVLPREILFLDSGAKSWRVLAKNPNSDEVYTKAAPLADGRIFVERQSKSRWKEALLYDNEFPGKITPAPGEVLKSGPLTVVIEPKKEPGLLNVTDEGVELVDEFGKKIPVEFDLDFGAGGLTVRSMEDLAAGHNFFLHIRQDISTLDESCIEGLVIHYRVE